ncbi:MAG TPA: hypothetical protein DDY91_19255 [Planctomycetaceae bacterium]|nr:hypothetical protein [Planctomycetaceae bacterium]
MYTHRLVDNNSTGPNCRVLRVGANMQLRRFVPPSKSRFRLSSNARAAFTLTELLVVISILVLLTSIVVVAMGNTRGSDRVRSAARAGQSSILGARDRATQAKEQRGIRFIRDPNDPTLIVGFQHVRPLPLMKYGGVDASTAFAIMRPGSSTATSPEATIIAGTGPSIDWFFSDSNGLFDFANTRVRLSSAGSNQWYKLVPQQEQPPFFVVKSGSSQLMKLAVAYNSPALSVPSLIASSSQQHGVVLELQLGNEVSPFTEPMPLPTGMVIDLKWSSQSAKDLASLDSKGALSQIDLMFTPRGNITGPDSVNGPIHFLIHDLQDAVSVETLGDGSTRPLSPISPRNRSDKIILTIFPATGNVQSFPIDSTDVVNNADGSAGPDGLADDLFRLARNGSGT